VGFGVDLVVEVVGEGGECMGVDIWCWGFGRWVEMCGRRERGGRDGNGDGVGVGWGWWVESLVELLFGGVWGVGKDRG
jgi:hypothetical protein